VTTEKVRKLSALARSSNQHEATLALEKALELERKTAKGIALAIATLLKERGLVVQARRHGGDVVRRRDAIDAEVSYRTSRARRAPQHPYIKIEITEYE
jgi:hypothetical protein